MYYLRKEPYEENIIILNGETKTFWTDDRAIYKDRHLSRFYRQNFYGLNSNPVGMKLYTCKTLKKILELRQTTFDYCGEWFDVYDENGIVDINE